MPTDRRDANCLNARAARRAANALVERAARLEDDARRCREDAARLDRIAAAWADGRSPEDEV